MYLVQDLAERLLVVLGVLVLDVLVLDVLVLSEWVAVVSV